MNYNFHWCSMLVKIIKSIEISMFVDAWSDDGYTKLYWPESEWSDDVVDRIRHVLNRAGVHNTCTNVVIQHVPIKDWNETWNASVVLLWIRPRSVIRASWHLVTGPLRRD